MNLDHLTIVLHKPRLAENIGAAARAARNMGISRLVVVQPEDLDQERMLKMATGSSAALIHNLVIHQDLASALGSFHYIVGTTARLGGSYRQSPVSPRELARQLIPISQHNQVALLFGPENWGLTNEELAFCHTLVTIPTSDFRSLNLAQAVLVVTYEIFLARRDLKDRFVPRLANSFELEAMYTELQDTLVQDQLYRLPKPGTLDDADSAVLLPSWPAGRGSPGYPGHLPADRLVRPPSLPDGRHR